MIRQTEEIDTLVKDMITVTRMDWEQLEIKKTPVSLWEVLDRELERLAVLAEEKRIQIISCLEEDWILPGDRRLLEEAFYNLLSNAAAYNREEGRIRVILTEGSCVVEKTFRRNICPTSARCSTRFRRESGGEKNIWEWDCICPDRFSCGTACS